MTDYDKLNKMVSSAKSIVFFGGAGVSTESGIPDFRSADGLYKQKYKYSPEMMLSHDFFMNNTEDFYDFYKTKMIYSGAAPNACHKKLAELEKNGKLSAVITQNIDGLHQKAGSKNVIELHGSVYRNFCMSCRKKYGLDHIESSAGVPRCDCGAVIKPDVVLYGEQLDDGIIGNAVNHLSRGDLLIVGGTSLGVYPAAGLCRYFNGMIILINKSATYLDDRADMLIRENIGEVFEKITV